MQSFKFSWCSPSFSLASKDCLKAHENTKHTEAQNFTQKPIQLSYLHKQTPDHLLFALMTSGEGATTKTVTELPRQVT